MSDTISVEHLTHAQAKGAIADGGSLKPLVEHMLARAGAFANDPFLELYDDALERAEKVSERIKAGTAGPLAGMVLSLKDNICVKGKKISASSQILKDFESIYDATVVQRLLNADATIIGRVNCDEFAMGGSNENSSYGLVSNPYDNTRVPGGSSGGSAASVAAGMCHASLGSDTGGSIRQPAAFCGVVGMKPTYGRVSRYGLIAFASSFDQIGPLANTVEDAGRLYEAIAGADQHDSTTSDKPVTPFKKEHPGKLKIGWYKDCLGRTGLDPEIKTSVEKLLKDLEAEGHQVEGIDLPMLEEMVPAYYVLTTAEASSNLARFDGIHYGHRSEHAVDVDSSYTLSRSEGFGAEVQRRIMLGTFVLSAGYYDAYYSKAQKVRRMIRDQTYKVLEKYDIIITPTSPTPAFEKGKLVDDPIAMYLQDIFTVQASLAGIPAISIPLGEHSSGLPIGVQFMGKAFDEELLLQFAHHVEQNLV